MTCSCCDSDFQNKDVGHVVTGDLRIVKDRRLRKLLEKGPSYREPTEINWKKNLEMCTNSIKDFKHQWAKKEKLPQSVFTEWESTILEIIKLKVKRIKSKHKRKGRTVKKQVLNDKKHLKYLKEFHKQFVLVPADKASNNIIVVCKKFYVDVVLQELGNSSGSAYQQSFCVETEIISDHLAHLKLDKIEVPDEMHKLPTFYWLPKMHKTPIGSRFIAASSSCTTKPLSKLITKCLQLVMEHYRQYNSGITRRTSVNTFWIINNSMEVLTLIDKLNKNRKTKHFDTFDFSTLYTSIPHDILLESLNKLIIEAFRIRGATFISVSYDNVFWSNTRHRDYVNTPAEKLIEYIKFLVDNVYISVGNRIYKQTVGIPMGTDCAPMLANLFLFSYEYAYTKEMLKTDYGTALAMRHTVRYIDDLLTFNNPTFKDKTSDLYPPTLTLKKTTESPDHVSYLDLLIRRHTDRLTTSVYDKRDNFNFYIVKYPHMDSNIPSKPAYGVYISQLVRISRICDSYVDFNQRHVELTSRLQKQGYKYDKLCQAFKKFTKRHNTIINKFGVSIHDHIKQGISLPLSTCTTKLSRFVNTRRRHS